MNSTAFALIACRRTGSNYLMKIFDSFPEMEFFGEVYHRQTVWMPKERKKEYIEWLTATHNIKVKLSYEPFEDKELVNLNHEHPKYFLDFLVSTTKFKYAGFKVFPEHLHWRKLKSTLLANREIPKIILKRNLLDVYISDRILKLTNCSQNQDTSSIKIDFDCLDFQAWYFDVRLFYSRVELFLKNSNQRYAELSYEEIHSYSNDVEKIEFLQSWLYENGIEVEHKPKVANFIKKQDKRKQPLVKVKNAEEVEKYLIDNNLDYLIRDRSQSKTLSFA